MQSQVTAEENAMMTDGISVAALYETIETVNPNYS